MPKGKLRRIGALWLREGKKGNKYMSGVVEVGSSKINVLIFKNTDKQNGKSPDYLILTSEQVSKPQNEEVLPSSSDDTDDMPF